MDWLREALAEGRHIPLSTLGKMVGVHRHTVRHYMRRYGFQRQFADLSDDDLDTVVRAYRNLKPISGIRYIQGFLRVHGLRVQRERIRLSLRRIDALGQALRNHEAIDSRKYSVPHSNYLWHLDGHHKLIQWGFVVHGIIDGYDHTVCS